MGVLPPIYDEVARLRAEVERLRGIGKEYFLICERHRHDKFYYGCVDCINHVLDSARVRGCERDKALAQVSVLLDHLIWCSGSPDFNEGGQAREGWIKGPAKALADLPVEARVLLDRLQRAEAVVEAAKSLKEIARVPTYVKYQDDTDRLAKALAACPPNHVPNTRGISASPVRSTPNTERFESVLAVEMEPLMRSAEEWAKSSKVAGQDGLWAFDEVVSLMQAYARECVEAWREKAVVLVESHKRYYPHPRITGRLVTKPPKVWQTEVAAALRALPGETS